MKNPVLMLIVLLASAAVPGDSQPVDVEAWVNPYKWTRGFLVQHGRIHQIARAYLNGDKNTVVELWNPTTGVRVDRRVLPDKYSYKQAEQALEQVYDDRSIDFFQRSAAATIPRNVFLASDSPTETIQVYDSSLSTTVASIDVSPRLPGGLALSDDGKRLYATLWRSTTATPPLAAQIAILNTATNQIVDRITLTADMLPSKP